MSWCARIVGDAHVCVVARPFSGDVRGVDGRNDAGPIRYLSPDRVARLADALADQPPDELGHTQYDEAAMDDAGVYPGRWVQDGEDFDQLGIIRELYSYVRDYLVARKRDRKGVVFRQKEDEGRWYTRADASAHPKATPKMLRDADTVTAKLGYRHVGDFVLERRASLAKSHGAPVVLEANLRSASHAWDSYGLKFRIGRRR